MNKNYRSSTRLSASEAELIAEVIGVVEGLDRAFQAAVLGIPVFGGRYTEQARVRRLVDTAPTELPDLTMMSVPELMCDVYGRAFEWDIAGEPLVSPEHLKRTHAVFVMRALYDYVTQARWPERSDSIDFFLCHATLLCAFSDIASEMIAVDGPSICRQVLERAIARSNLDIGLGRMEQHHGSFTHFLSRSEQRDNILTLRDIALLANMSEKSVRNATFEQGGKGLRVERDRELFYVKPEEALRWLRGRRGFKETRFYTSADQADA